MHNIFEFTPNLIGILGSASFTNFKLQKKIKDLSEFNYSLIEVNDVFILDLYTLERFINIRKK